MFRAVLPAWSLLSLVLGAAPAPPGAVVPDRSPGPPAAGLPPALVRAIRASRQARAGREDQPADPSEVEGSASESRELARAKFEALHADVRELARRRVEAAWGRCRALAEEYQCGRGMPDRLWAGSTALAEAEAAIHGKPEAWERGWERAWSMGLLEERRFAAGRVAAPDHALATCYRLETEARWLLARAENGSGRRSTRPAAVLLPEGLGDPDVLVRDLSEAKRAVLAANLRELTRARVAAARRWCQAQTEEYLAGRGPVYLVLDAVRSRAEAEAALPSRPEDRAAAFEGCWARLRAIEEVEESRFTSGKAPLADYLETRFARLGAEVRWLRAQPPPAGERERPGPADGDPVGLGGETLGRARRRALQTDPRDLEREQLAVAREAYRERWHDFFSGRGELDRLLATSRQWLNAKLAVAGRPSERAAAWERYWTRSQRTDRINEARYQQGRVAISDWAQARCARLDAEIGWAEAREEK